MMLDEKLSGVMLDCARWQAVAASIQSGVLLPRRKAVQPMDDWARRACWVSESMLELRKEGGEGLLSRMTLTMF